MAGLGGFRQPRGQPHQPRLSGSGGSGILKRPRVGVSACLLGQAVRYDGASRPHAWIRDRLPRYAEIRPFCPETGAGLGVPRPAVQLVRGDDGRLHVCGVDDPRLDVTDVLRQWMELQTAELQRLDAMVFKSRSPSCGLASTPLFDINGNVLQTGVSGVYAAWVQANFPEIALCDDAWLGEKSRQAQFLALLQKKAGLR
ncbi:DUF523 domain-containing protein [Thiolapillus sp.]